MTALYGRGAGPREEAGAGMFDGVGVMTPVTRTQVDVEQKSAIADGIRGLVSKKKKRFQDDGCPDELVLSHRLMCTAQF